MAETQKVTITLEIEINLYKQVMAVFDSIGITMEEALALFFQTVIEHNGLPFPITEEEIEAAKKDTRVRILFQGGSE